MRDPEREAGRPGVVVAVALVAAAVLALTVLGATSSWGPVVEVLPYEVPTRTAPLPTVTPEPSPSQPAGERPVIPQFDVPDWLGELLRALAVVAVVAAVVIFLARLARALQTPDLRRAAAPSGSAIEIPEIDEEEVASSLADTLASLRSGIAVDDAVVECWRRLEQIAADGGVERRPSQTSEEFTVEILAHAVVDRTALADLSDLYRQALFSTHVLGDADRERAIACVEHLAAQLGAGVADDAL